MINPYEPSVSSRASTDYSTKTKSSHYHTPSTAQQASPYIFVHLAEPCTAGDLSHKLNCSHRVITTEPETCASNCQGSGTEYANPKDLDSTFRCDVCIHQHLHSITTASPLEHEKPQIDRGDSKKWFKTLVGYMLSTSLPLVENERLVLREGRRECGAVFDPVVFESTGCSGLRLEEEKELLLPVVQIEPKREEEGELEKGVKKEKRGRLLLEGARSVLVRIIPVLPRGLR